MSVLVKGMRMPTQCVSCSLWKLMTVGIRIYDICSAAQNKIENPYRRPDWCPLVDVPPHGDLIERKAVCLTDFEIAMCDGDYKEGMKMLLEKIESAPTIIPAEEGEG